MGILELLGLGKDIAQVSTSITDGATDIIVAAKGDISADDKGKLKLLQEQGSQKIDKLVQDSVQQAREFAIKYEGSAEQVPKWLLIVRSLIRPVVTILTFGWFFVILCIDMYHATNRTEDYVLLIKDLPQGFWLVLGVILTFCFGGKAVERVVERLKPDPK